VLNDAPNDDTWILVVRGTAARATVAFAPIGDTDTTHNHAAAMTTVFHLLLLDGSKTR
jgi:hypothetical protein